MSLISSSVLMVGCSAATGRPVRWLPGRDNQRRFVPTRNLVCLASVRYRTSLTLAIMEATPIN